MYRLLAFAVAALWLSTLPLYTRSEEPSPQPAELSEQDESAIAKMIGMTVADFRALSPVHRRLYQVSGKWPSDPNSFLSISPLPDDPVISEEDFSHVPELPLINGFALVGDAYTDQYAKALEKVESMRMYGGNGNSITDETHLRVIEAQPDLEKLYLDEANDAMMRAVGKLRHLEFLDVNRINAPHAGLTYLADLSHLRSITIRFNAIDAIDADAALALGKLPRLERLRLDTGPAFDEEAMSNLAASDSKLESFVLRGRPQLTSRGIERLRRLKHLRSLVLDLYSSPDDEWLQHLASMQSLTQLGFGGDVKLSDGWISNLLELPALRFLYVERKNVSPEMYDRIGEWHREKISVQRIHTVFNQSGK